MLHYNLTVGNYDKPVCPDSCTTFSVVIGCLGWDMAILGRPPGLPIPMGVSCPPLKPFSLGQPGNRNFQHFTALHLNLLLWQFFQQSYDNWKYWAPCPSGAIGLRPPRGSIELIFTEPINPVSLEQFHHKPTGMYADGPFMFILDTHEANLWFCSFIARCSNGTDEPHLHPSVNLGGPPAYNHIGLWWLCWNVTRLKACEDELHGLNIVFHVFCSKSWIRLNTPFFVVKILCFICIIQNYVHKMNGMFIVYYIWIINHFITNLISIVRGSFVAQSLSFPC